MPSPEKVHCKENFCLNSVHNSVRVAGTKDVGCVKESSGEIDTFLIVRVSRQVHTEEISYRQETWARSQGVSRG